jgi:hypothetical protein
MTQPEKKILLLFITRTGMFISEQDKSNIVSFIHGYELGRGKRSNLSADFELLLTDKYKTPYSSTGWPGQIEKLAQRSKLPWTITFKQVTLEIIASEKYGGLNKEQGKIFRGRFEGLLSRIKENGDVWFNDQWVDEWLSFCLIKQKWFKELWSKQEFQLIKLLNREVIVGNVFGDKKTNKPSRELLGFSKKFSTIL